MAGGSPIYYWDTCLFLAWLNDEERKRGEMDGVREIVGRSKRREVKLVTSVLTQVEVLQSRIPVGLNSLFVDLLKRMTKLSVDTKIASLAHDIRDYALRAADFDGKVLTVPDAIHLATAILYHVDEFHTFDERGSAKALGLLPLSGDVGGHRLKICKPDARSPQLHLRRTT